MILVDANLLLYAEDSLSVHHKIVRPWWDEQLSGEEPVCLCWPVLSAFIRISTNPRLHLRPLTLEDAIIRIQSWIEQPCVRILNTSTEHWRIFREMLRSGNATANLVSDARLAAFAVEHNCRLYSTDRDFARFPKLKWVNPVSAQ